MLTEYEKTKNTFSEDRRKYPRYSPPVGLPVIFETSDCACEGEVRNISQGGFFLAVKDGGAAESVGRVLIRFPHRFFRAAAAIRFVQPGQGFGIEFTKMNEENEEALAAYCEQLRHLALLRAG